MKDILRRKRTVQAAFADTVKDCYAMADCNASTGRKGAIAGQTVAFGDSLAGLEYPEIPKREGYYEIWPDCSDKIMTGNLLIEGEYKEDVTVVESNEKQAADGEAGYEKPYALVEQRFTENTVLRAFISDREPPAFLCSIS